jgi:hypothetical protein
MAQTAPETTARDQAHLIHDAIPPGLFRTEDDSARIPWRVSPEPFALSPKTVAKIEEIGTDLLAFYRALNALYNRSARGTAPAFIAEYLDKGKPENMVRIGRQNRFRSDIPGVIRPDLLLTETGFAASELDSVPGGMGFTAALMDAYSQNSIASIGGENGMARGLAAMLKHATKLENPTVAIVVSDESGDYRVELSWLAARMRELGEVTIFVCKPQDIIFTEQAMFMRFEDGREEKLDCIYRNFELFDLLNVPKQELMLYAARRNRVLMVPPPKAQLEEKLSFALFHHPALAALWKQELGKNGAAVYDRLAAIFPQTWVLDPRPLPPQGVIAGLSVRGVPLATWHALDELGKGERDFVIKPSGFSELAWGSRGVKIANDLTKDEWVGAIDEGLQSYSKTPHILQRFHKSRRIRMPYLDTAESEIKMFDGRARLCPYYFVTGETTVQLGGILATIAPADKRLIHGMVDAVMTSCFVKENGY